MELDHKAILYFPDRWSMNFDQNVVSYFKDKHNACTMLFDEFISDSAERALEVFGDKWVDYGLVVSVGSGADFASLIPPDIPKIYIDPIPYVASFHNAFIIKTPFINDYAQKWVYKNSYEVPFDRSEFRRHVIMDVVESYGFWFEKALDKAIEFFDKQNGSEK